MEESERPKQEVNATEEGNQNPTEEQDTELQAFLAPGSIILLSDQTKQDIDSLLELEHAVNLSRIHATSSRHRGESLIKNAEDRDRELVEKARYLSRLMDQSTLPQSINLAKLERSTNLSRRLMGLQSIISPSKSVFHDGNLMIRNSGEGSKKNKESDGTTATTSTSKDGLGYNKYNK